MAFSTRLRDHDGATHKKGLLTKPSCRILTESALAFVVAVSFSACPAESKIVSGSLYSASNGRVLEYRVYTPPGYNPNQATRYPVVFSLHGNGGKPAQRSKAYAPTLDQKINSGQIMPMIWVFPDGQRDTYYGNAYDGNPQVYSHIVKELLPHIDANFKTIGNRANRAMEGFSVGGFGSGLYAAKDTQLFSAALLYGAVLPKWPDLLRKEADVALNMYNNIEANWRPYSIYDVTTANAAAIANTVNFKMIVGSADGNMNGNLRFRDHLLSLGINPQFQVVPGVAHEGGQYLYEGSGLAFLNSHFLRARQGLSSIAAVAVPEPRTCWLIAIGTLSLIALRGSKSRIHDPNMR